MCNGIRILRPFHLATQIISMHYLNCPKRQIYKKKKMKRDKSHLVDGKSFKFGIDVWIASSGSLLSQSFHALSPIFGNFHSCCFIYFYVLWDYSVMSTCIQGFSVLNLTLITNHCRDHPQHHCQWRLPQGPCCHLCSSHNLNLNKSMLKLKNF